MDVYKQQFIFFTPKVGYAPDAQIRLISSSLLSFLFMADVEISYLGSAWKSWKDARIFFFFNLSLSLPFSSGIDVRSPDCWRSQFYGPLKSGKTRVLLALGVLGDGAPGISGIQQYSGGHDHLRAVMYRGDNAWWSRLSFLYFKSTEYKVCGFVWSLGVAVLGIGTFLL